MKKIMSSGDFKDRFWVDLFGGLGISDFPTYRVNATYGFDSDRYEIVEKKDWRIKKVEGEIDSLKGIIKHYTDQLKQKEDELEEIKREKKK